MLSSYPSAIILILPIVIILVIVVQYVLIKKYDFKCSNCGSIFSPSLSSDLLTPHSFGRKRLRCPKCGQITWVSRVPKKLNS